MTTSTPSFPLCRYGESLDGPTQRSLGFRLLLGAPDPWSAEVELLARRLQATSYPEIWQQSDLFCSILLGDAHRLVAVVRYGGTDRTPERRRGGLDMLGAVVPTGMETDKVLKLYRKLRDTSKSGDPAGTTITLEAESDAAPHTLTLDASRLPIRLADPGAMLFYAQASGDADRRLDLLYQMTSATWQWLPLIGADFPLQEYALRGPTIAWTVQTLDTAVHIDVRPPTSVPPRPRRRWLVAALLLILLGLLAGNLWALLSLHRKMPEAERASGSPQEIQRLVSSSSEQQSSAQPTDESRERFARALYQLLQDGQNTHPGTTTKNDFMDRYERLVRERKDLAVREMEGKWVVGWINMLATRKEADIEKAVRDQLAGKIDERLLKAILEIVLEQVRSR